jgi:LysR family transcriptional activator of mexEF-oprN operon
MPELHLNRIDLNLLTVFATLMEERSVTRAGQRLNLSQPATSGALNRLRKVFRDPLFIRTGRAFEPTARARADGAGRAGPGGA